MQYGRSLGYNLSCVQLAPDGLALKPSQAFWRQTFEPVSLIDLFRYYRYTAGSIERNHSSCGSHPEADAQQAMGNQLTPVVQKLLGW